LEKGKFLGIIVGIGFFLVIIIFIFFLNSDFDQQLIKQVQSDTPTEMLIAEIKKEAAREKSLARKDLDNHIMDMKYWDHTNTKPENDLEYVVQTYKSHMKTIQKCEEVRIMFVEKKISKEKFLEEITSLKLML
jgi:hypothetical protein